MLHFMQESCFALDLLNPFVFLIKRLAYHYAYVFLMNDKQLHRGEHV